MTIAIAAATSQLGRLAVAAITPKLAGETLVALTRSPDKAADLGVEVREADYKRPETLAKALDGVTRLVLISSGDFDDRVGQHRNVIEAARTAGVRHLIYTSILKGQDSTMAIAADHKATEQAIAASGIPATILRNGWYLENYTGPLGGALQGGAMIGCSGEGKLSAASRADLAEAIAVVASADGHEGKTYELAGDSAFTMTEMATEVSRVSGRDISYKDLPEQAFVDMLKGFGLPEPVAAILADGEVQASRGALFDDSGTLSRLIGRPTTSMPEAVAKALA